MVTILICHLSHVLYDPEFQSIHPPTYDRLLSVWVVHRYWWCSVATAIMTPIIAATTTNILSIETPQNRLILLDKGKGCIACLRHMKSILCGTLLHKNYWNIIIFSQKWVLRVSQGGSIHKKLIFKMFQATSCGYSKLVSRGA